MEIDHDDRLWYRITEEFTYINRRLAEPNCTPKTTIVLMIMKKRLERIVEDAYSGEFRMSFADVEKEADKLE